VPGHDKAAGLGETPRRHEKNATSEGKADDPGNRFPGRGRLGRREQPAHEPLILRATLGEVPLTGLFFEAHPMRQFIIRLRERFGAFGGGLHLPRRGAAGPSRKTGWSSTIRRRMREALPMPLTMTADSPTAY
jgi:hypothetical protein